MFPKLISSTVLILFIYFTNCNTVFAQKTEPKKPKSPEPHSKTSELEQKKLSVWFKIKQIVSTLSGIENKELRIASLISVGNIISKDGGDKEYAQSIFEITYNLIKSSEIPAQNKRNLYLSLARSVSGEDNDLAKRILAQLESESQLNGLDYVDVFENLNSEKYNSNSESYLEKSVSGDVDPRILIRLLGNLLKMRSTDAIQADTLYMKVLSLMLNNQQCDVDCLLILGNYPFTYYSETPLSDNIVLISPISFGNVRLASDIRGNRLNMSQNVIRFYLKSVTDLLKTRFSNAAETPRIQVAAYMLLDKAKTFYPELLPELASISTSNPANPISASNPVDKTKTNQSNNDISRLESELEEIEKIKDNVRHDERCLALVEKLYRQNRLDFSLKVTERVRDPELKEKLTGLIQFRKNVLLLEKGDIEPVEQTLRKLGKTQEKTLLRVGLVNHISNKSNSKPEEIVYEAQIAANEILKEFTGYTQSYLLLFIVEIIAKHNPNEGFSVLQDTVKSINKADTTVKPAKLGEVIFGSKKAVFNTTIKGIQLGSFYRSLKPLMEKDVDLTLSIIDGVKKEEMIAQAAPQLVKLLLESIKKT